MRLIFLFLALIPTVLAAQSFQITGKVIDSESGQPLEFATVSLMRAADSSLVTGAVTDGDGAFQIKANAGNYFVRIQFVTYEARGIPNVRLSSGKSDVSLGIIGMSPSDQELDEVVVQAERTQMQLNLDKKVYNVGKDLSNLGGSASDMLDNLPSVTVDVEGNVELRGSSNVKILIDGRPSGLVGLSSTDALKQLQSNLIESVEIITNPSARYDAEGQAGIINIILKKDKQKGLNGTFQASTGYPHNHGVGINMNFRKKWVNFFVNYGFNYDRAPGKSYTNQYFTLPDTSYSTRQVYDRSRGGFSNNIRLGADFNVGQNSTLTSSFLYRYSRELNLTDLSFYDYDNADDLINYTLREDDEHELDKNLEYSLNYSKDFKRKDHKLTAVIQYQDNFENEMSDIVQSSGPEPDNFTDVLNQKIDNKQGEERLMLQADYVHPFSEKAKAELGYRSTLRRITNDYLVEEEDEAGEFQEVDTFTVNFLYKEYVHAFYGIVSDQLEKFSWQVGLRTEISDIEADEINTEGDKVFFNYTNFFPSAFLTYKVKGMSQLQLSYSRRINRPRYRDLSPLSSFTNNRNFRVGNPELQPEYTDSYEFGYLQNFDNSSIYYGVYYRYTDGPIQRVSPPANEDGIVFQKPENLGVQKSLGFEVNANQDFAKWYRISGNFNFYHQQTIGSAYGENLDAETVTFTTRISNNLKFKDVLTAQVNVNYRAPQNQPQGRRESVIVLDLGLSKDLWEKKGTLSLSVRDLFNSRKYRFSTETTNYTSDSQWQWRRGPQFVLTLNYRLNQAKERKGERSDGQKYDGIQDDF